MHRTFPLHLYLAALSPANNTPLGDQLNLYPSGLSEASGAGSPPHHEVNEVIRPFSATTSSNTCIAVRWSMPGSKPISFSIVMPACFALEKEII